MVDFECVVKRRVIHIIPLEKVYPNYTQIIPLEKIYP